MISGELSMILYLEEGMIYLVIQMIRMIRMIRVRNIQITVVTEDSLTKNLPLQRGSTKDFYLRIDGVEEGMMTESAGKGRKV